MMAVITVNLTMSKNLATLDANSIQAILTWIDTNIKAKLPPDATMTVQLIILP